ncbi:hypothetical protein [Spirulina sp. 06S082]|uniref:hypothetical protein n=1 Tax=Spirulina sp. 06S082 TaxID=3110248 RepID=UPI002B205376|nr:hypothetical protein [Spirulina sp. 06S082]MEA5471303.1 hypothetical protein [Spirulina sp. 06S082]
MSDFEDLFLEDQEFVLNLPYHLAEAGMADKFCEILMEFEFLNYKISVSALQLLIEDYDFPKQSKLDLSEKQIETLQIIQRTLQQSSHILQQDKTQLVEQLFGRLSCQENYYIELLLTQARTSQKTSWLCPITPSLTSSERTLIRILKGHNGAITYCALSNDGKIGLSGSTDCTLRVWNLVKGTCEHILVGHNSQINACSLSGNGEIALSASDDKTLRLWNTKTGKYLHILRQHTGKVTSCALSENSEIALSGSYDKTLRVWDTQTGECLLIFHSHTDQISCCDLSSDGKKALSGSYDGTLILWDTQTGECLSIIENNNGCFRDCSLNEDATFAVSISDVLVIEDLLDDSNELVGVNLTALSKINNSETKILDLRDSSDENNLFLSSIISQMIEESYLSEDMFSENFRVRLWDINTGECIKAFETKGFTNRCQISKDGGMILATTNNGMIHVWDNNTEKKISDIFTSGQDVSNCCVNRNKNILLAGSNLDLRIWTIKSIKKPLAETQVNKEVVVCNYSNDGNRALCIRENGIIQIWNTKTGYLIEDSELDTELDNITECLISSTLETALITTLEDFNRNVYIIDLKSGEILGNLDDDEKIVNFAMSKNGKIVVYASNTKFYLINIKKEAYMILEEYVDHKNKIVACNLNENGYFIISAYKSGILRIKNLMKNFCLDIQTGHRGEIVKCAISDNGLIAVSISQDGTLRIWNAVTGDSILSLPIESELHHFVVSNDGELLLYSPTRYTVKIVKVNNGQVIGKFTFDSWVSTLAFSSDSTQIMVGDYSGCVHFLQLEGLNTSEKQLL